MFNDYSQAVVKRQLRLRDKLNVLVTYLVMFQPLSRPKLGEAMKAVNEISFLLHCSYHELDSDKFWMMNEGRLFSSSKL